ncbi:MAG TPA: cysteine desulfurase family protein [Polyangiaceae bacterium]
MRLVYLDNFATTPLDHRVLEAMLPYLRQDFGNPASDVNLYGQRAQEAVERARQTLRRAVGCEGERDVIFTSGGTESNNLVIRGIAERLGEHRRHLVISAIEHESVLEPTAWLSDRGFRVTYVPVDLKAWVDPSEVSRALRDDTLLVSVMAVNNEIGTIQPLAEIGAVARSRGAYFHCDAAQAMGKVPIDMARYGIDFLSISAHKIYGPKGVGALCSNAGDPIELLAPQLLGGGQEYHLRSGTLNVAGIVGLAKAVELMQLLQPNELVQLRTHRNLLLRGLEQCVDGIKLNGDLSVTVPGALNISIEGVRSTALLARMRDIAVSSTAGCCGQASKSHVLSAMGLHRERIQSALRFGIGRFNTSRDIDFAVERIAQEVKWIRSQRRSGAELAS